MQRSLCGRAMVLRGGRLVEEGSVAALIDSPREEYTRQLVSSVLEVSAETGDASCLTPDA